MDKKKVIDIFPPGKDFESLIITEEEKEYSTHSEEKPPRSEKQKSLKSSPIKKGLIFGLPVLVILFIFCLFTLGEASVEVWPETEDLFKSTDLTVDEATLGVDYVASVIPGKVFEKEKVITENFPATGKIAKEVKAEGIIKVYNEYSTKSQVLIASTRFISADGKLFRTPKQITIPGGHYEGSKFIAGEIDVRVLADKPGPDYNIEPTTFSIPGFAGTAKYTKFYAKSFQLMTGGFSEEIIEVTEKDLEEAEKLLRERIIVESEKAFEEELLSEKFSPEYIFAKEAIETEVIEVFSFASAGEEVDNFNFQIKVKSKTILFKKEDLDSFVNQFISSYVVAGQKLYKENLEVDFSPKATNLDAGKISLSLEVLATIYSDINETTLKNLILGKSAAETKVVLGNVDGIDIIEVEFWPFWVNKVPEDLNKINFKLTVD